MNSWKDSVLGFLVELALIFGVMVGLFFLCLGMAGYIVTDVDKQFLKNVASLKAECEKYLPRTQQCVIQCVPEQQ